MVQKIIFGDNQFFGVNHMSETKAQRQQEKFSSLENIIETLNIAYTNGVNGFMLHSHPRAEEICTHIKEHEKDWSELTFYPAIPHPGKYLDKVGEMGLLNTVFDVLSGSGITSAVAMILKGSVGFFFKDPSTLMKMLIDIELRPFKGLPVGAVFLQNIVTDLVLGLGLKNLLKEFHDHIIETYKTEVAYITENLPLLIETLKEIGIDNPLVMSAVNKRGFFMNPSKEACEDVIKTEKFRLIPMAVLASGAIPPNEAFEYVFSLNNVVSVIFGASSKEHILSSIDSIKYFIDL